MVGSQGKRAGDGWKCRKTKDNYADIRSSDGHQEKPGGKVGKHKNTVSSLTFKFYFCVLREVKLKEMTVGKLEEMEKKLVESEKSRAQTEKDMKTFLTSELDKQKVYVDGGVDSVRKLGEAEGEKMRGRLAQFSDDLQNIDATIAEMKSNINADLQKIMQEADSREKVNF